MSNYNFKFKPTIISKDKYNKKLLNFINKKEGDSENETSVYADPVGIPTVGAGYALAVRGKDGKAHMRSREYISIATMA
ncbi:MAG: hypothetical protein GY793_02960 [Proteobacteria bacterium]|nr:hypothetical protein [Pseudomonadota bacterium]